MWSTVQLAYVVRGGKADLDMSRDPRDRPTAERLLTQHEFCELDTDYNFFDTDLYAKIRGTFNT